MRMKEIHMKKIFPWVLMTVTTAVIITLATFGPSVLAKYNDANVLNRVGTESAVGLTAGFRYSLNANERVYILSMALKNQVSPQTDYAALTRGRTGDPSSSFAYTENRRGSSPGEMSYEEALKACDKALAELQKTGVIPDCRFDPDNNAYDINLYTAVDISDPQKNISVWQIVYASSRPISEYRGALLEAWLDAETGALYGFSLRSDNPPESFEPDALADAWRQAAGLTETQLSEQNNPLSETTPHYKKYILEGLDYDSTVVTVGYYEGINEIFVRIT